MKITLAPFGTASDVLPMLALAKTLQSRGHAVTMCAPEEFRSRLYKAEVPMVSSGKTYEALLESLGEPEDNNSALAKILNEDMAMHFVALRDAAREAEVLVGGRLQIAGPSLAEQRRIPYFYAVTTPVHTLPDTFPVFGVSADRVRKKQGKRLKEWNTHVLSALNREREIAHLPPVKNLYEHVYASGSILFALDRALEDSTLPLRQIRTGFWYLESNIDLDQETEKFLSEGKKPIYIAAVRFKDDKQLASLCETLVSAGHRVVLGPWWAYLEENGLPAGTRIIQSTSYSQIFPKLAAVVHGGFADVAMHAMRSRIPQVIAPHTVEQSYWGTKCQSLGVSLMPVRDPDDLQRAIEQAISDSSIAERLRSLAPALQDGTEAAAIAIESAY